MKTSSVSGAPKTVDKPTAWACTVANLLTWPGLGTVAAGQKIGYAQAGVALVGFGLIIVGGVLLMLVWLAPAEGNDPAIMSAASRWGWILGLAGIGLDLFAWFWALRSSLRLHRRARENEAGGESDQGKG